MITLVRTCMMGGVAMVLVQPALGNVAPRFLGPQDIFGSPVYDMDVADFDEDGTADVAVVAEWPMIMRIALGTGDGRFETAWEEQTNESGPVDLTAGDINGDAHVDLVLVTSAEANVTVYLGAGDGTFTSAPAGVIAEARPRALELHDLDDDGTLDLLAAHENSESISVRFGGGDGTFGPLMTLEPGGEPMGLDAGDVDGDGVTDLVVATYPAAVQVLRGLGSGAFAPPEPVPVGREPQDVAIVDLDADGDLDMVVAEGTDDTVVVLQNDGAGGFAVSQTTAVGELPIAIHLTDLDGDGVIDVLVANAASNDLTFLAGTASLLFDAPVRIPTGSAPSKVCTPDIDGDGVRDLIVLAGPSTVTVQRAGAPASFPANDVIAMDACMYEFVLEDADDDGIRDLLGTVRTGTGSDHVALRRGRADGTFDEIERFPVGEYPFWIDVADVTGDDRVDIVTASALDDSVSVVPGLSGGGFDEALTIAGFEHLAGMAAGDLDGDGVAEIVTVDFLDVEVIRYAGDASFEEPVRLFTGSGPLHLMDFDGDGDRDVIAQATLDGWTYVLVAHNDGAGGIDAPLYFTTFLNGSISAVEFVIGDVNGDGHNDVVATSSFQYELAVLYGRSNGTLGLPLLLDTPQQIAVPLLHDVTGDGRLDLVVHVGRAYDPDFAVFPGTADGSFADPEQYAMLPASPGGDTYRIIPDDVDDDGDADLLVAHCADIIVLENRTPATPNADVTGDGHVGFDDLVVLLASWGPCGASACPADLDADGTVGFGDLSILLGLWCD